jgi:hypothetical protein
LTGTLFLSPQVNGITAQIYSGTDFQTPLLSQIDPNINYSSGYLGYLGLEIPDNPILGVPLTNFSAVWNGLISVPQSGQYTFYTKSDDGARLFVDGQELINDFSVHGATEDSGTIFLSAGHQYPIEMDYFQATGPYLAQLEWSGPSISKQIIPSSAFLIGDTLGPEEGVTLDLNDITGSWNMAGGGIVGGTIATSGNAELNVVEAGTLYGATLDGNLKIQNGRLTILDGLSLGNSASLDVNTGSVAVDYGVGQAGHQHWEPCCSVWRRCNSHQHRH